MQRCDIFPEIMNHFKFSTQIFRRCNFLVSIHCHEQFLAPRIEVWLDPYIVTHGIVSEAKSAKSFKGRYPDEIVYPRIE